MSDRDSALAVGVFLVLLSLGTAIGAVSLGTFQRITAGGSASGSYLVYNPFFEALSLLLALGGGYFFYQSGKSVGVLTPRANE